MKKLRRSRTVTVFDLDGVITRHDTMTAFVTERLVRRPTRIPLAIEISRELNRTVHASAQRANLGLQLVALAFGDADPEDYAARARAFARRIAADPDWINPQAVEIIRTRLDAGEDVLVLTGSERTVARELLTALGCPDVVVVGSELRTLALDGDGVSGLDPHLYGPAKVEAWEQLGYAGRNFEFFTDSIADLPLARLATRLTMVNPVPGDAERMSVAVPDLRVVSW